MLKGVAASLVVAVVGLTGAPLAAQASLEVPEVPGAAGGWVLEVITRGGIMGQGAGQIVIASDGRVACTGVRPGCAAGVRGESLRLLQEYVRLGAVAPWQVLRPSTLCSDCMTTTLVLTIRNSDGTLATARAAWDPTTRAQLAAEVVRIHDTAARLVQPLTR